MAGEAVRQYFTEGALDMIYYFSRGVPRLINQISDSALLSGYIYGAAQVDEKIMQEVINESPMTQITAFSPDKAKRKLHSENEALRLRT